MAFLMGSFSMLAPYWHWSNVLRDQGKPNSLRTLSGESVQISLSLGFSIRYARESTTWITQRTAKNCKVRVCFFRSSRSLSLCHPRLLLPHGVQVGEANKV